MNSAGYTLEELRMREEKRASNKRIIIKIGIGCFVIGILAILFLVGIKPAISKYILDKQQEAYTIGLMYAQNFMLSEIANSLTTKGYVSITFPNNQSVLLAPVNPNQGATQ
jgi:hypothetical protein